MCETARLLRERIDGCAPHPSRLLRRTFQSPLVRLAKNCAFSGQILADCWSKRNLDPNQNNEYGYRYGIPTTGRIRIQGPGPLLRHRHVRRQQRILQGVGHNRRRGGDAAGGHLPRSGPEHVRLGRHLFRRRPRRFWAAIKGRRDQVLISTKATFRSGDGPNDVGSSRYHLMRPSKGACAGWAPTTSTCFNCTASTR